MGVKLLYVRLNEKAAIDIRRIDSKTFGCYYANVRPANELNKGGSSWVG